MSILARGTEIRGRKWTVWAGYTESKPALPDECCDYHGREAVPPELVSSNFLLGNDFKVGLMWVTGSMLIRPTDVRIVPAAVHVHHHVPFLVTIARTTKY